MSSGRNQDRLSDLEAEPCYALKHCDPIGVHDEVLDFPPDEHGCLIGTLLTRKRDTTAEQASASICGTRSSTTSGSIQTRCRTGAFTDCLLAWCTVKNAIF